MNHNDPGPSEDYMREEIEFQSEILRTALLIDEQEKIDINISINFDEIWFTGSGDSFCASLFGSFLSNRFNINSRVFTPFDLSNYMPSSKKPLLIAISVSGKTPRVLEVVMKFKKRFPSSLIIGLTDNPNSLLVKRCTHPILIHASPVESVVSSNYTDPDASQYTGYHHDVAQTKTFFANIVQLSLIVHRLGKKEINYPVGKSQMNFDNIIKTIEQRIKLINLKNTHRTIFISSGIFRSLTKFFQYKWFEFTLPGLEQDTEEYAHTHYFVTDKKTTVVFIAPEGPILDRVKELIHGALVKLIKPQIIIISDIIIPEWEELENLEIMKLDCETRTGKNDFLEFYFQALVAIQWITYYTARKLGFNTNKFRGGVETEKYVKGSFQTIRKSHIRDN